VIEDDKDMRDGGGANLEHQGFPAWNAAPKTAIKGRPWRCMTQFPDLICSNLMLPKVDV